MRIADRKSSKYECNGLEGRFEGSVSTASAKRGSELVRVGGEGGGRLLISQARTCCLHVFFQLCVASEILGIRPVLLSCLLCTGPQKRLLQEDRRTRLQSEGSQPRL